MYKEPPTQAVVVRFRDEPAGLVLPGRHFVENYNEREQIGARIERQSVSGVGRQFFRAVAKRWSQ